MGNLNANRTDFDERWVESIQRRIQPYKLTASFHVQRDDYGYEVGFEVLFHDGDITVAALDVTNRGWLVVDAFIDGVRLMNNRNNGYAFDIYTRKKHNTSHPPIATILEQRVIRQAQEARVVFIDSD
jgi:hypothetical protein